MAKFGNESTGAAAAPARELEGLFRGIGNILRAATDLVTKADDVAEVSRRGSIGPPTSPRGLYGFSLRVGPARRPNLAQPVSISRRPAYSASEDSHEAPGDIFDEGDHYLVIVELPGTDEETLQWKLTGNSLKVESVSGDKRYHKQLQLPSPVNEKKITSGYKNGILELRLWKQ